MPMITDPSGSKIVAVTPSDSVNLTPPNGITANKYLYVGVAGDVVVVTPSNDTVTIKALAAGVFHPIQVKRVNATGTTATNILAVY